MTKVAQRNAVLPVLAAAMTIVSGCRSSGAGEVRPATASAPTAAAAASSTTFREQTTGWRMLVEKGSMAQWRAYRADTMPSGWKAEGDVMYKERPTGDIITRDQFGDFELMLEWKISAGGNGGIFYRGTEEYNRIYWSAPEYQVLDDSLAPDGRNPLTRAATNNAVEARSGGTLKPIGGWNETRILVRGAHVEHWLNGVKVVEYELWSDKWKGQVKASKFNAWPNYGLSKRGHIALQGDHAGSLHFRNIKIRELR